MKFLLPLFLIFLVSACDRHSPSPALSEKEQFTNSDDFEDGKINLRGKLPEQFDWDAYFERGDQSTSEQRELALEGVKVLKERVEQLCAQYRADLEKRATPEAVKLFDEMQQHWEEFANAEVELVGSAYQGGSGAHEAYPKHRLKVYLRRARELVELQGDCMFLNH